MSFFMEIFNKYYTDRAKQLVLLRYLGRFPVRKSGLGGKAEGNGVPMCRANVEIHYLNGFKHAGHRPER